jgi:hypothetical protein
MSAEYELKYITYAFDEESESEQGISIKYRQFSGAYP